MLQCESSTCIARHSRVYMTRALLEGVTFGLKDSFTLTQHAGLGQIAQVRVSGGGTKGALWRQIMASVLDAELVTVNTTEGAAYGAALLAGVGVASWNSVEETCSACIKIIGFTQPVPAEAEMYRRSYDVYRELYPALKSSFQKM